jgi:hypothetical protein
MSLMVFFAITILIFISATIFGMLLYDIKCKKHTPPICVSFKEESQSESVDLVDTCYKYSGAYKSSNQIS